MTNRPRIKLVGLMSALIMVTLVAGCEDWKERVKFDGNYYPPRARALDANRDLFLVSVGRVSRGLNGARQAVAYEAMRYCIKNFGNSQIIWDAGPDRQVTQEDLKGNRLAVTGKCVGW